MTDRIYLTEDIWIEFSIYGDLTIGTIPTGDVLLDELTQTRMSKGVALDLAQHIINELTSDNVNISSEANKKKANRINDIMLKRKILEL